MKNSEFIQICKNLSQQNLSTTIYDNSDWIFFVKGGLNYIFNYLNRRGNFVYAATEETVVPVNKIATTQYHIQGLIDSKLFDGEYDDSDTGVLANGNLKVQGTNFFPNSTADEFSFVSDATGITGLKFGKDYTDVRIRYKRGPVLPEVGSLTSELDLPVGLESALLNLCLWMSRPVYLENGVNLANAQKQYADDLLLNYSQNLGDFMNKLSA